MSVEPVKADKLNAQIIKSVKYAVKVPKTQKNAKRLSKSISLSIEKGLDFGSLQKQIPGFKPKDRNFGVNNDPALFLNTVHRIEVKDGVKY